MPAEKDDPAAVRPRLTELLNRMGRGDRSAGDQAAPLVYGELRRIAGRAMRKECAGHALQTTALVHEAYIRLIDDPKFNVDSRGHFFALASLQMRRVLVDCARAARAGRRGAGAHHESLDAVHVAVESEGVDILMLDFALTELEQLDPRAAKTVELKFFAGLTDKEAAEALGVSPATIRREWDYARTWLMSRIRSGNAATG